MKIPKNKIKVNIVCIDGSFIRGFMHVAEGLRLLDFLNNTSENFIAVTEALYQNINEVHSFKLVFQLSKKKDIIFLNKNSIKWLEAE
ncbi:MAG: hypothetical protein NC935_05015 [Candidatus Omnitrophica bacterium]|nr:hypothetical protein [Candidatus Omnitrophota bacterium]